MADELTLPQETEQPAPATDKVYVISPQGKFGHVPSDQLQDALDNGGYKIAPPEAIDQANKEAKLQAEYGDTQGQVVSALAGATKGIAGFLAAPLLEQKFGLSKEQQLGLREANPIASGVGEAAGFIGSAVSGIGEAELLTKAGKGLEALTGLGKGAGRISQGISGAAKAAFEGALWSGDEEAYKAWIQDPSQTSDSIITNVGMGAILTGLFGGATGALFRKAAAPELSGKTGQLVSELDHPKLQAGDFDTTITHADGLSDTKKFNIIQDLKKAQPKVNAPEIKAALKEIGAEELEGLVYSNKNIQVGEDHLLNTPHTPAGERRIARYANVHNAAENAANEASLSKVARTKEEAGQLLQDTTVAQVREKYAPIEDLYSKEAALHEKIPLHADAVQALSGKLGEIPEARISPHTDEGRLVKRVLRIAEGAKTARDLDIIAGEALLKDTSVPGFKDPLITIKTAIKDAITAVQHDAIDKTGDVAVKTLSAELKAQYKPYISSIKELASWLGKSTVSGTKGALHFIDNLTSSEVAQRLFSSNRDPAFIKFFKKDFPAQWEILRDYQRNVIRESSLLPDGRIDAKKLYKKLFAPSRGGGLEPEVREALYSAEELKKISSAYTVLENFPKAFNPPNTAHAAEYIADLGRAMTWGGIGSATAGPVGGIVGAAAGYAFPKVRDAALEKWITRMGSTAEGAQAVALAKATIKGENAATKAVKSIFNSAKELPSNVIPLAAARAKLDKLVTKAAADPTHLVAMNDNNNSVPEYNAPLAASAARVVNYLSQLKPQTAPTTPLDSKRTPSSVEKSMYDRALDIAEQPLTVLHSLKAGRITPSDVQALQTMYPNLYNKLASKINEQIIDSANKGQAIPYKTRMGLSVFLGQPLDSTMMPMNIISAQPKPPGAEPGTPTTPPSGAKHTTSSLDELAKSAQTPGQARAARAARR